MTERPAAAPRTAPVAPPSNMGQGHENPLNRRYHRVQKVGEGTYGVVYKAKHKKTGVNVAVKVINKRSGFGDASGATTDEMVRREVAVLERVGMHKNISGANQAGSAKLLKSYQSGTKKAPKLNFLGKFCRQKSLLKFWPMGGQKKV